jgi:hypothetical protein
MPNVPVKCALYTFTILFNSAFAIIWCLAFGWLGQTNNMTRRNEFCALTGGESYTKNTESMYPPFFLQSTILRHVCSDEWHQRYVDAVHMTRLLCLTQTHGHHLHSVPKRCVKRMHVYGGMNLHSFFTSGVSVIIFKIQLSLPQEKVPFRLNSLLVCWVGVSSAPGSVGKSSNPLPFSQESNSGHPCHSPLL